MAPSAARAKSARRLLRCAFLVKSSLATVDIVGFMYCKRVEARARWPLEDVTIIHRVGRLLAGDQIVLVATASAHRQAAFDAAQFIMDFLKTDAPFWKAEERGGKTSWVDARDSDSAARDKWTK